MSLASNLSRTISPAIACEALTTVAKSRVSPEPLPVVEMVALLVAEDAGARNWGYRSSKSLTFATAPHCW